MKLTILLLNIAILISVKAYSQSFPGKNPDGIFENITQEYILNADGSIKYNYEHTLKILTPYGYNHAYGETFIVYNPDWQKLSVNKAVTTMADGKKVDSPKNAFNEVLPQFAPTASPYMNMREMVVTHTGLEKSSVVNLSYTIDTKAGYFPGLTAKVIAGDRTPIKNLIVKVKVPAGKELKYYLSNSSAKPVITKEGANDVYIWTFNNLPLAEIEDGQPILEEFVPVLFISTVNNAGIIKHIIPDNIKSYELSDAAKNIITELIKNKKDKIEQAFTIRNYVEKNVSQMTCDLSLLGYRTLTAQQVFDRNIGSQLDRAILLVAMLKAAGIQANPVMLANAYATKGDMFFLNQFNNVLVVCSGITTTNVPLFLDPNNIQLGNMPNKFQGKSYFTIKENSQLENFPQFQSNQNTFNVNGELEVTPEGKIVGSTKCVANGAFSCSQQKTKAISIFKRIMNSTFLDATVKEENVQIKENGVTELAATIASNGVMKKTAGIVKMQIPFAGGLVNDFSIPHSKAKRTTPVEYATNFTENYSWKIALSEGWRVSSYTKPRSSNNELGSVTSEIVVNGKNIIINRKFELKQPIVPATKYLFLLDLLEVWNDPAQQYIYIESTKE